MTLARLAPDGCAGDGWPLVRMSGEVDYLLKVLVKDIAAYDRFYRRLIAIAPLDDVSSSFAMEQIKFTTALPL